MFVAFPRKPGRPHDYAHLDRTQEGFDQGGLEALPRVLRAAYASHFVTHSITFSRGAEFCTFLHRCFLVEFGAMERKKVRCTFLQCRLCCYLTLRAKKRFETVENPHIFDAFI